MFLTIILIGRMIKVVLSAISIHFALGEKVWQSMSLLLRMKVFVRWGFVRDLWYGCPILMRVAKQ